MRDPNKLSGRELLLISRMLILQGQINNAMISVKAYEDPESKTKFMVSEHEYGSAKAIIELNRNTIHENLRGQRKPVLDAFKRAKALLPK